MIHPLALVDETCTIGAGSKVWQFASLTRGVVLGMDCSVAPGAMLDGCTFGDRCLIGPSVSMGPGFLVEDDVFIGPSVTFANDCWPTTVKAGFDVEALRSGRHAVIVEDRASIGANAVILPGVRIRSGAMIAAGAVVTRDVEPGCLFTREGVMRPIGAQTPRRMRYAR